MSRRAPPPGTIGPGGPHGAMVRGVEKAKNPRATLMRLGTYLLESKFQLALVVVLVILGTVLSIIGPYLLGVAIDSYITKGDLVGLTWIVLLMFGVYLGTWFAQSAQGVLMAPISQKALRTLRKNLFEHLQTLSLSFFDRRTHGELMSRLTNDIDAINQALTQNVTQLAGSILSLIGILIAMFALNVWLALGSLTVLPIMVLITIFIGRKSMAGFRSLQAQLGRLNGRVEEVLGGERVVQAFRKQRTVLDEFDKDNLAVRDAGIGAMSYAFVILPLVNVMSNLSIAVVAGLGGWMTVMGWITVGLVASFITYARNFVQPLRQLADLYNSIQTALAGAERVFEIMDEKAEIADKPGAISLDDIRGDVVFDHVDFSYVPGVPVLKDMSFHAEPGQVIAFVGPTGAGKTTMINVLGRFYDIQRGSIKIDGIDIRDLDRESLRRQLGTVLQDNFLFADTVMENIRYGKLDATNEECIEAAKLANADQFITRLPQGYKTLLTERGSNLSQGQRQLLAIARAVIADPRILILDEATSSVDTRTELRIQQALLKLMEGRTSFVIAHRLSTIRKADQVLVIKDGVIVERGSHESLLAQKGFYYNLYVSQFKGTNNLPQS
ncbi:ABC transporter ATP-binding protein/permease [Candidatus Bathyarchaeota archaeon]|nr:ABC transporter ATP-binding protein/permease [Candidatus Bathyarchaeota archaeon]